MRKNKLILLSLAAVACSKHTPQTLIAKWESKSNEIPVVERTLASAPQGQCLKDIFSVDVLSAEVKELEKKYAAAPKVSGTWKHLDLSKLPVPQANFLKTYGDKIGDQRDKDSIDYSTCEDVPCIYNRIYGKENDVAGYVHYLWYLKFGNMLSADNMVPSQSSKLAGEYNGKVLPLSQYLYSRKELYGMWRLSLMLRTPHTTLSYLKEVQRVPRGEDFEGAQYKGACGLAYSQGWILLNDGCLTVYDNREDTGYLYQAVTHELTHHVDFEQGRGTKLFYRSHKQDYLDLAGMFIEEFVDKEGKPQRQWKLKPGTKLPTSYAGTAPQENFAEAISVFRVDGDHAKKQVSTEHFDFVSKDYYQTRSFEKEMLMKAWIQQYAPETGKNVFKAVVDCSKESASPKSNYFRPADFSAPVLPGMLNCFGVKAQEISNSLRGKTAMYEPEGCLALNDYNAKGKWDIHMKDHLKATFDKYLQELQKDKEYLARIQSYYSQLSDKTIAREAFLSCYAETGEELCFQSEIRKGALEKAMTLKLPAEQTQEMADMYVSYHSYDVIREEIKQSYKTFVAGNLEGIRKEALATWEGCFNLPHNDDQSPSGSTFQIADGYMVSSLYNCLNANIPDAVKEAIRNFSVDGMRIQHAKEEVILTHEVQPALVKIIKDKYISERAKERVAAEEVISQDKGEIRKQLLSGFDWVKNVVDTEQIVSDCKREGTKLIKFTPVMNLKSELFGEYLEKNSCLRISESAQFIKWLDDSQDEFSQKVSLGLQDKMEASANARAQVCLKQYPTDSAINRIRFKKQREACLIDEWPKLEAAVLDQVMSDPLVVKFQMSRDSLKMKLATERRRVQLRVIKEHFN